MMDFFGLFPLFGQSANFEKAPSPKRNCVLSEPVPVADEPGFYQVEVTYPDLYTTAVVGLTAKGATDAALLHCQVNGLTPLHMQGETNL